jgi:hypothetical protein
MNDEKASCRYPRPEKHESSGQQQCARDFSGVEKFAPIFY